MRKQTFELELNEVESAWHSREYEYVFAGEKPPAVWICADITADLFNIRRPYPQEMNMVIGSAKPRIGKYVKIGLVASNAFIDIDGRPTFIAGCFGRLLKEIADTNKTLYISLKY